MILLVGVLVNGDIGGADSDSGEGSVFLCRREAAKGNKNQTKKPWKVQIYEPKEWDKC